MSTVIKSFITKEDFPTVGLTGIIYKDTTTTFEYKWTGHDYAMYVAGIATGKLISGTTDHGLYKAHKPSNALQIHSDLAGTWV